MDGDGCAPRSAQATVGSKSPVPLRPQRWSGGASSFEVSVGTDDSFLAVAGATASLVAIVVRWQGPLVGFADHGTAPLAERVWALPAARDPGFRSKALLHELSERSGLFSAEPVTRLFVALPALGLGEDALELNFLHESAQR